MPLPIIALPALAGSIGPLLTTLFRFLFLAHMASFIVRAIALMGLSFITNEAFLEPALGIIQSNATGLPGELAQWMSAFGFDKVLSIIVSAYTLLATKRIMLGRRV